VAHWGRGGGEQKMGFGKVDGVKKRVKQSEGERDREGRSQEGWDQPCIDTGPELNANGAGEGGKKKTETRVEILKTKVYLEGNP